MSNCPNCDLLERVMAELKKSSDHRESDLQSRLTKQKILAAVLSFIAVAEASYIAQSLFR